MHFLNAFAVQRAPAALLLFASSLSAQGPAELSGNTAARATSLVHNGRLRQTSAALVKATAEPRVDGVLDEAVWRTAVLLTGFSQFNPVDRLPAEDSTEVLVTYTDHAILIGVRAFEAHGPPVATLADRDRIASNDHIELYLDTFNDRRRALVFGVNALGVQSDGVYTEGAGTDANPDFLFESKGAVTTSGYEIEIRIPFKSIRYQQVDVQQWGLQVIRRVMHSGHEQTWTPAERSAPSFLAQSGALMGLSNIRRGLVLDVNPVVTSHSTGGPQSATDPSWRYTYGRPEYGGTVRWGVTPNMSINATANPDFSQVEADVGQVVYDPRAAISFPEKRPFFLEANENFQVPNSLIYTRRIVSPIAAAKASGKVGGLNVGVLSAIDDAGAVTTTPGARDPVYNLLRLRRDVGPQSHIGMVYTDRMVGGDFNRVIGFDSRQLIGSRHVLSSQIAGSFHRSGSFEAEGRPLFDFALTRTGRESGYTLVFEGTHPEFMASSGFISRAGIVRAVFQPRRQWYPKNSALQTVSFSIISDNTWEWDRFTRRTEPNDIKMNTNTTAIWKGGWSTTLYTWTETFKYPAFLYTDYYVERRDAGGAVLDTVPFIGTDRLTNVGAMTRLATPQWQQFSGSAELIGGQDDNFDEWSSAWIMYTTVDGTWRPTDKARINGRWLEQRVYRKSDGSLVRLRTIPRLKVEYQVTRPIFVRMVAQYDGLKVDSLRDDARTNFPVLIRTPSGYEPASAQERAGIRLDWLFSYQPNPGTVFFAGYGASYGNDMLYSSSDLSRASDNFFVKLSYVFRR
ncbi:MAG: DUF5916 domain-containing protein [Gemmatimonadaceae bacterium]